MINSFSMLTIGKVAESTDVVSKRYIGLGSTKVLAINPTKAELDKIYGRDMKEPEYIGEKNGTKWARIDFIVETDPAVCNNIKAINKASFFIRNEGMKSRDGKIQVIDSFGNTAWASEDDVKAGNRIMNPNGKPAKIDVNYRPAYSGEADLVAFLKSYLVILDAFNYIDGQWVIKDGDTSVYRFQLDYIKNYFNGDFKEIREAYNLMPNNKVKLLYGIRTVDGNQYQDIALRQGYVLRNNAGANAVASLEKELARAKAAGSWPNTEFRVCELQEYTVEPTDFSSGENESSQLMPWEQ